MSSRRGGLERITRPPGMTDAEYIAFLETGLAMARAYAVHYREQRNDSERTGEAAWRALAKFIDTNRHVKGKGEHQGKETRNDR